MNVALASRVPAQFVGLARQFRDRVSIEDIPAGGLVTELAGRAMARFKRNSIPRLDMITGIASEWRDRMPQFSRLRLQADLDRRRKSLRIFELRLTCSEYQDPSWDHSERGVILYLFGLEIAPFLYNFSSSTTGIVSMHALARRMERSADTDDESVKNDLRALALAHRDLAEQGDRAEFRVPVPGGVWRGAVRDVRNALRGDTDRALAVRTFVGGT
jgi:hypothetical protein